MSWILQFYSLSFVKEIKSALNQKNAKICNVTFEHGQWQILVIETATGLKNNHVKVAERSLNSSSKIHSNTGSCISAGRKKKKHIVFMYSASVVCLDKLNRFDRFAMRMLFFAGAVCLHPWCHFGGMSLWWHHHTCQSAPLCLLRHEPSGSADQLQPH